MIRTMLSRHLGQPWTDRSGGGWLVKRRTPLARAAIAGLAASGTPANKGDVPVIQRKQRGILEDIF